jgi:hypothetical protein
MADDLSAEDVRPRIEILEGGEWVVRAVGAEAQSLIDNSETRSVASYGIDPRAEVKAAIGQGAEIVGLLFGFDRPEEVGLGEGMRFEVARVIPRNG